MSGGKHQLVHLLNGGYIALRPDRERGRISLSADSRAGGASVNARLDLSPPEAKRLADLLHEAAKEVSE